jgi:hypothetical protein
VETDDGAPQPTTDVFAVVWRAKEKTNFSVSGSGPETPQADFTVSQRLLAGVNWQLAVRPVPSDVLPELLPLSA